MPPVSPSPSTAPPPSWSQRLVEQLRLISEVSETLTYRLLELEERLAAGERQLALLGEQARDSAALPPAMETWLEQTDERLGRVEELLRRSDGRGGIASAAAGRSLMAVRAPLGRTCESEPAEPDPFPQEEEQAFLDEQIA